MIIAHLADSHLGCVGTGWQRNVPDPFAPHLSVRQQEADIRSGFAEAVDRILAIRPDLVLHAGDLFDQSHPTPHAVQFAFAQLRKLSVAGIPIVLLEGDHSAPRVPAQGEPLQIFAHLPGVTVICGDRLQILRIGTVTLHAIPHRALIFDAAVASVESSTALKNPGFHVLLSHGVADSLPFYQTHRAAGTVRVREIAHLFDYVALGHCHRFCQVEGTDRAFYAGATAMVSTIDFRPNRVCGFNVVTLHNGRPPEVRREHIKTPVVRLYGLSNAWSYTAEEILRFMSRQVEAVSPVGAFCRVAIEDINPAVRSQISLSEVERLFSAHDIVGLSIQLRQRAANPSERAVSLGQTPRERFLERVTREVLCDTMREQVKTLGDEFFDQAEALLTSEDQEAAG